MTTASGVDIVSKTAMCDVDVLVRGAPVLVLVFDRLCYRHIQYSATDRLKETQNEAHLREIILACVHRTLDIEQELALLLRLCQSLLDVRLRDDWRGINKRNSAIDRDAGVDLIGLDLRV